MLKAVPYVALRNGVQMPIIGMGTGCTFPKYSHNAVKHALENGYTYFDTAHCYGTEEVIGEDIKKSGIKREKLFISTKVWPTDYGYENTKKALDTSLGKLQMDHVDLYLLNWPDTPSYVKDKKQCQKDTWKAMEELYKEGKCRAIGVSNYLEEHLEELFTYCDTKPHFNQIEYHPYCYPIELQEFCEKHDIVVGGYSPLAKAEIIERSLLSMSFEHIANKYDKSIAQVLIRWSIQHNVVTIPKTTKDDRALENIDVFDFKLTDDEMMELDGLSEVTYLKSDWDPTDLPSYSRLISSPP